LANYAQGRDPSSQCTQVGADGSGSAGTGTDSDDLVGFQPGLERGLAQRAIQEQVFIEKKVSDDQDVDVGKVVK
jgi:hypothetical protein